MVQFGKKRIKVAKSAIVGSRSRKKKIHGHQFTWGSLYVTVIVVRNKPVEPSSNTGQVCISQRENHHHHVAPSSQISLTLSRHPSLVLRPLLPAGLQEYIPELLYVGSCWSSCLCLSMWRGPQEYITYESVLTSPAVSHMSGSSNFDSFRDE